MVYAYLQAFFVIFFIAALVQRALALVQRALVQRALALVKRIGPCKGPIFSS